MNSATAEAEAARAAGRAQGGGPTVSGGSRPFPEPIARVVLRIDGARARVAPATWSQWFMRRALRRHGEWDHILNSSGLFPVPEGGDLGRVLNATRELLRRYETLRTTYQADGDGVHQVVPAEGEVTIDLYETSVDHCHQLAEQVAAHLSARSFSIEDEWPVRFAVVLAVGRPAVVVVALSHIALDHGGSAVVAQELSRLLAGGEPGQPPAWQPADQAGYERSPEGMATSERALAYVRGLLQSAPPTMFDFPTRAPETPRYVRLRMESEAVTLAAATVAKRLRMSTSSVLLAATAVVLGHYSGRTCAVLQLIAANRANEPQRSLAANVFMEAACGLDFTDRSFDQTVQCAFEASVSAHMNAEYDPTARWELRREHELAVGRHIDLSAYFNDNRTEPLTEAESSEPALRSLLGRTVISEDRLSPRGDARFSLQLVGSGASSAILLLGDTAYLPRPAIAELLLGIERLLVAAATHDVPAHDLSGVTGVRTVERRPGWVPRHDGYVDLAATRELWREVMGTGLAETYLDAGGSPAGRLVAYACTAEPHPSITDLHRRFVSTLGEHTGICAPDWYVLSHQAPWSPSDRDLWTRLPVAAEGSGR